MSSLEIYSNSAKQTRNIGIKLGKLAAAGDIILLVGPLGAGKTCLTQGIALGLGIDEYTASPSFVLVREYHGRLPLYHMDLYRLDKIEEMSQLGLDDYFSGNGVCVVEWADKALELFPQQHILIEIQVESPTQRKLKFQAFGEKYLKVLSQLKGKVREARK